MPEVTDKDAVFVWPPGRAVAPPAPPATRSIERHTPVRRSPVARLWRAVRAMAHDAERVWLDVRCPVLGERLEALGWSPDAAGDYCTLCGRSRTPPEDAPPGCRGCEGSRPGWSRLVRVGAYEPPLTRVVQEVKFSRWHRLGSDLGKVLGKAVAAEVVRARERDPGFPRRVVVVPVPTTFRRRMGRGIDHAGVLAGQVAKAVGGRVARPLRRTHRRSQLRVIPSERVANVAGTMHARTRGWWGRRSCRRLGGALVIVVDDVTTTGATLRATVRAVRQAAAAGRAMTAPRSKGTAEERELGVDRAPVVWVAVVAVTELEEGGTG